MSAEPLLPTARLTRARTRLRRAVLRRRRPIAAVAAAVAVLAGLRAVTGPPAPTVEVLVAAHDLPAGVVLADDDLEPAAFAEGTAPDALVADAVGRVLAAPLTAGEPVTAVRLVGPELAASTPGTTALPVRLPDAAMVGLLEVGDAIDLVATDPADGGSTPIADDVAVLALPGADADPAGGSTLPGRLVVLGVAPDDVPAVTDAAVRSFVTYTWSSR